MIVKVSKRATPPNNRIQRSAGSRVDRSIQGFRPRPMMRDVGELL